MAMPCAARPLPLSLRFNTEKIDCLFGMGKRKLHIVITGLSANLRPSRGELLTRHETGRNGLAWHMPQPLRLHPVFATQVLLWGSLGLLVAMLMPPIVWTGFTR